MEKIYISNLLEEEANAVEAGVDCDTTVHRNHVIDPPETATVTLGGKNFKWCGSTTHSRESYKDCPHNPKNAPASTLTEYLPNLFYHFKSNKICYHFSS